MRCCNPPNWVDENGKKTKAAAKGGGKGEDMAEGREERRRRERETKRNESDIIQPVFHFTLFVKLPKAGRQ